jgi:hypothetical protein
VKLRKISASLLISAFAALLISVALGSTVAQADDKHPRPRPTAGTSIAPDANFGDRHGDDDEDERSEHDQLRERYGDDGIEQVFLPPLVVTDPGNAFAPAGQRPKPGSLADPNGQGALTDATNVDPKGSAPIDLKRLKANEQTPAETFFEIATIGLVAMGAGSAALGAVAIRRAVKLRKTPNSDFIYE